jgi:DNA-binding SARP family transcriptional activator
MDFRLLGPVEARTNGRRVPLSGEKIHTVLAVLLLARAKVVTDARLCQSLWGWDPPATMQAQLYTYVSRLRALLGPDVALVRRPPGYLLLTRASRVDVVEFETLHRQGRTALAERRYADAGRLLHAALDLWRGPALGNVTPFLAQTELPRLEETRMLALEHRIEADLALARHADLVPELTGLVAEFPLRERLRAQLMTALYHCGRQADAMRVHREGLTVLVEELGTMPGACLRATYQAMLDHTLGLTPTSPPAPVGAR